MRRVDRGQAIPIPPSEFLAWTRCARVIVNPSEYAILCAMDAEWCREMNAELKAYQDRERERAAAEHAASKRRKG